MPAPAIIRCSMISAILQTLRPAPGQRSQRRWMGQRSEACRGAVSRQGLTHLFSRRCRLRKPRSLRISGGRKDQICDPSACSITFCKRGSAYLLKRPVGRPSNDVCRSHASFTYRAGSWSQPRRVVGKVEWHPGELYPRVGFIVTNMSRPAENVVAFYNKRGTCEQWIKEGKGAIKWTRLSCRSFAANAVRLQLHALAYNLGNFLRTLATPEPIKDWSLTTLKGEVDQDWREVVPAMAATSRSRWPRLPFRKSVRQHSAADCGVTTAARYIDSVTRSVVMRPIENYGRLAP